MTADTIQLALAPAFLFEVRLAIRTIHLPIEMSEREEQERKRRGLLGL